MKGREMVAWMGMLLAGVLVLASGALGQKDTGVKYEGAKVASAGDIAYPVNTRTPGMVTLDVNVDASGASQNMAVARDVPPLTSAAESGVKGWKFTPAKVGGQAAAGVERVNVVFNPFNPGDVSIPTKPLPPPEIAEGATSGTYRPPDVKTAKYAVYPPNTVASGTVVLEVKVGGGGNVESVKVVKGVGVLSTAAEAALKGWEFVPASYEGKAVRSHTVVVFVFVAPQVGTM